MITLSQLEEIILEQDKNVKTIIKEEILSDKEQTNVDFEFKEFKKHNRLDCTLWISVFPYDFKIYLTKDNVIYKTPFKENKNQRLIGERVLL